MTFKDIATLITEASPVATSSASARGSRHKEQLSAAARAQKSPARSTIQLMRFRS
jgi:hypothetical protein